MRTLFVTVLAVIVALSALVVVFGPEPNGGIRLGSSMG